MEIFITIHRSADATVNSAASSWHRYVFWALATYFSHIIAFLFIFYLLNIPFLLLYLYWRLKHQKLQLEYIIKVRFLEHLIEMPLELLLLTFNYLAPRIRLTLVNFNKIPLCINITVTMFSIFSIFFLTLSFTNASYWFLHT